MTDKKIILASKSPRRRHLLELLGIKFDTVVTGVDETVSGNPEPAEFAEIIALRKTMAAADSYRGERALIIGSDTIVTLGDMILGKPADDNEAGRMLRMLSGRTHTVITAIAIADSESEEKIIRHKKTQVTFRELEEDEIKNYTASGSPRDKAGAYGIQDDFGAVFVRKIEGCYYNVVGLPLEMLYSMLKEFD